MIITNAFICLLNYNKRFPLTFYSKLMIISTEVINHLIKENYKSMVLILVNKKDSKCPQERKSRM